MAELDPRVAAEQAEKARQFLEAFTGQRFDDDDAQPFDRRHLGHALDWLEELTAMVANLADRVPKEPVVPLEGVLNFVTLVATDTRGLRHEYIESRSGSMVRVPDFHGLQLRHNT